MKKAYAKDQMARVRDKIIDALGICENMQSEENIPNEMKGRFSRLEDSLIRLSQEASY